MSPGVGAKRLSPEAVGACRIVAPIPGTVIRILAEPGVDLPAGAPLLVIEAMKMEHTLRAPVAGHLKGLKYAVGDFVDGAHRVRAVGGAVPIDAGT